VKVKLIFRTGRTSNLKINRLEFRIITALVLRQGAICSRLEMIDAVWLEAEDGGPLTADNVINVMIFHIRKSAILTPLRLEIYNTEKRGIFLGWPAMQEVAA
jgi:DNA-binding response OmpR family regulator